MTQRLVCFDNIDTKPRTHVLFAETMEDLYSFVEGRFAWFDREKFEILVSDKQMGAIHREYVRGNLLPKISEDLYIKVARRKSKQ